MKPAEHRSECRCECHRGPGKDEPCPRCGCRGPSRDCNGPRREACPPPEACPFPGTVELPQDDPPPKFTNEPKRPELADKPPRGDAAELPWFRNTIRRTLREGPTFGPRKDEYLPFLFMRASSGDIGNRPLTGVFWESPDIYVLSDVRAEAAPLQPPSLGGVAKAQRPNTLYAHVWNSGKAPARRVRVEFYWFNPTLGISRSDANFIGATTLDLGNRFSLLPAWKEATGPAGKYLTRGAHAIVKCPVTWVPEYVNGGHECLVVRVTEPMFDALPPDQFSAVADRRVGQRNIAVVPSASPAAIDLSLQLGYLPYEAEAEVDVELADPMSMEWLKLYTGRPDIDLRLPARPVTTGMLPASPRGSRPQPISDLPPEHRGHLLLPRERFKRGCDPLEMPFHASIDDIKPGEVQVVRVRQRVEGMVVGGYSVVLIGA